MLRNARLALLAAASVLVATPAPAVTQKPARQTVYVYTTKTGHKYHLDGCRYLKRSKIKLSEAKERALEPCSVCQPPR